MLQLEGYKQINKLLSSVPLHLDEQASQNFHKHGKGQIQRANEKKSYIIHAQNIKTNIVLPQQFTPPCCSLHPDVVTVCESRLDAARLTATNSFSTGRLFYTDFVPAGFGNQQQQTDTARQR